MSLSARECAEQLSLKEWFNLCAYLDAKAAQQANSVYVRPQRFTVERVERDAEKSLATVRAPWGVELISWPAA